MVISLALALTLSTGTVSLHLTDAHGKPIPNHEIWLEPTNSTKSVRSFGVQWGIPSASSALKGTTNAKGDVKIGDVKKGMPMAVVTQFGPRFDEYVRTGRTGHFSMDILKFEGAVYAGKPAHIVLADDNEITGRVTDLETGAPLPRVTVTLFDTGFGHMGGYPLTDIDEIKTDAEGRYVFRRLPGCSFIVRAHPSGVSLGIESRADSKVWRFDDLLDSHGKSLHEMFTSDLLVTSRSVCDFRISRAATLSVLVGTGSEKSLRGWTLWTGQSHKGVVDEEQGYPLDWVGPDEKSRPLKSDELVDIQVFPGIYTICVERSSNGAKFLAKTVTVRPGEHRRVEFTLSSIAKRKPLH